jgi:cell division protein FtsX
MKNIKPLLLRSFREGSIQVWRNKFLSGTTILLGALILFLLNFVFSIQFFADYSLQNLEKRADFSLELRADYDAFEFDALKNELGMYEVEVEIFPAETIDNFQLPPRLHVQFLNLREVNDVFEILKKGRYDSVIGTWDGEGERDFVNIIDNLLRVRDGVEKAGYWLIAIFLAGGILLMVNTFRIVIFSRKNEVFIARFVGANTKFIAGPFLVEGFLLGITSSVLAIIVFVFVLKQINILPAGEIFMHLWNNIFSFEILISGLVGMLGAWIAVRKYLSGKFSS